MNFVLNVKKKIDIYRCYWYWYRAHCIFIHVPKAAGTTLSYAIYGKPLGHFTTEDVLTTFPNLWENSFVFGAARNPYSRIVSAYAFAKQGRTADMGVHNPSQYHINEFRTFRSFVLEWLRFQELGRLDGIFQTQSSFLTLGGCLAVDHIVYLESIHHGIDAVEKVLRRRLNLDKRNVTSTGKDISSFYCRETAEVIQHKYEEDFKLLGYSMDIEKECTETPAV
jgi:hypothetical protein